MNPSVILRPEAERPVREGYPRVLQKEVLERKGEIAPGAIVDVLDSQRRFLARGFANPYSRVLVRVLTQDPSEEIDEAFFYRRLVRARQWRERHTEESTYRAVFSESDGLPGLIVDRFEDYLVCQIGTLGMETRRDMLFAMLREIYQPKGLVEKSSASMRKPEHLPPRVGVIFGKPPEPIPFRLHGLWFLNPVMKGQKTGFFLDQRDNREAMRRYVREDMRVLDGFCYTGGFSVVAAHQGAQVTAFDISDQALEIAREVARNNGVQDRCTFEQGNAFHKLREFQEAGASFDMVILDPPAFAKHRGVLPNALRGYRVLNRRAMALLSEGGILVSCSCTQLVSEQMFLEMLAQAAQEAGRRLRVLEVRGQPFDHPVLSTLPETRYLKCVIAQAV